MDIRKIKPSEPISDFVKARTIRNGLTPAGAVPNAKFLTNELNNTTNGIYYIQFPDGNPYPVLCKLSDYGGGWMNLNVNFGQYSAVLTGNSPTGGGNYVSGLTGDATAAINSNTVSNSQHATYGCGGGSYASQVYINQTIVSAMNLTELRMKIQLVNRSSTLECASVSISVGNRVTISGNTNIYGACSTSPNRYGDLAPSSGELEAYGTLTSSTIFSSHTACAGGTPGVTLKILEIWVR